MNFTLSLMYCSFRQHNPLFLDLLIDGKHSHRLTNIQVLELCHAVLNIRRRVKLLDLSSVALLPSSFFKKKLINSFFKLGPRN